MTRKQMLDELATFASDTADPLKTIEEIRWELRDRVFRAALKANGWSNHHAAAALGRTTSTVQSALETHHHELERERLRQLAELGRVDRR
jgi:transcriptional regulator with GAF, ATPase, and Fis domain